MKYVFVCKYGQDRSPTAAYVAEEIAKGKGIELETASLGLSEDIGFDIRKKLFDADKVFVMEEEMIFDVRDIYKYGGEVINLDIKDSYQYMDKNLVDILKEKLERFL